MGGHVRLHGCLGDDDLPLPPLGLLADVRVDDHVGSPPMARKPARPVSKRESEDLTVDFRRVATNQGHEGQGCCRLTVADPAAEPVSGGNVRDGSLASAGCGVTAAAATTPRPMTAFQQPGTGYRTVLPDLHTAWSAKRSEFWSS